jgi:predicted nucleic acid-binding protein
MNAVDTNVLFYCLDVREQTKRPLAQRLIEREGDMALMWQVACEFAACLRKLERLGVTRHHGRLFLDDLLGRFQLVLPDRSVLVGALRLQQRYSLSFWDANLVAACLAAGVDTLYTEDFAAQGQIEDLRLVDPFAASRR